MFFIRTWKTWSPFGPDKLLNVLVLLISIDTGLFACITPTKVLLVSCDWVNVALIIFSPPVNWPPDVLVICEILKGTKPPAICDTPRLDAKIGAFEEAFP